MSKDIKPKLSKDQRLLNNFYDFSISEQRLKGFETKKNRMIGRYFLIGLGFGLFYETLIVKTSIYENIIKKSTLKRLGNSAQTQKPKESRMVSLFRERRGLKRCRKTQTNECIDSDFGSFLVSIFRITIKADISDYVRRFPEQPGSVG